MVKKIVLSALLLTACAGAFSQNKTKYDTLSLALDDLGSINLPPLELFLEAASNYAEVKLANERINEQHVQLRQVNKDWLKYIRLQGDYHYGTTSTVSFQSTENIPTSNYGISTQNSQNWYNAGVVISIPLDDLLSRKNKSDIAKSKVKQYQYEAEGALEKRQIIILEAYNQVVKNLALMKVKAEAVALYDAQMQISERDFVNGTIDIISLSLERARRSSALVTYQQSRAELHNAVSLLEMLTRIKIMDK